jgi:hypothetical protein
MFGSLWDWLVYILHKPIGQFTLIDILALWIPVSFIAFFLLLLRKRD